MLERRHQFHIHAGGLTAGTAQKVHFLLSQMVELCPSLHYTEEVGLIELDSELENFEKTRRLGVVADD